MPVAQKPHTTQSRNPKSGAHPSPHRPCFVHLSVSRPALSVRQAPALSVHGKHEDQLRLSNPPPTNCAPAPPFYVLIVAPPQPSMADGRSSFLKAPLFLDAAGQSYSNRPPPWTLCLSTSNEIVIVLAHSCGYSTTCAPTWRFDPSRSDCVLVPWLDQLENVVPYFCCWALHPLQHEQDARGAVRWD
jgi:hypothetical protein